VPLAPRNTLAGLVRLVHPFPIVLDGIVSSAVALLAGGDAPTALRLGVAMVALQASIGALNDVVDAPIDVRHKPDKPIPAGLLSPARARMVVFGSAGLGIVLTAPSGPGLLVLAGLGLAIGYAYDLRAKGTAWSWLPFALGIPLLPVFGWYGVTAALPTPFAIVLPTAVVAGSALAIANALADLERDRAAGIASVATWLGPERAWAVGLWLHAVVVAMAIGSLSLAGAPTPTIAGAVVASGVVLTGLGLGRRTSAQWLEGAWEVQAIGIALLGATWLWGTARPG
jgi:4-hydroxybenzoate polyprenyltransferase